MGNPADGPSRSESGPSGRVAGSPPSASVDDDGDALVMARVAAGDREAFSEIIDRHRDGVYRFFLRSGWVAADAEDLAQDVFVRVYTHAADYVPSARFTTFLYRVARNLAIDQARRRRRRGVHESLDYAADGAGAAGERFAAPAEPPGGLESGEAEEWRRGLLREALESLPERERAVFALSSEDGGMPYAEIAATLGIPVGTVKSRMHAAVHRLRDHLRRRGLNG